MLVAQAAFQWPHCGVGRTPASKKRIPCCNAGTRNSRHHLVSQTVAATCGLNFASCDCRNDVRWFLYVKAELGNVSGHQFSAILASCAEGDGQGLMGMYVSVPALVYYGSTGWPLRCFCTSCRILDGKSSMLSCLPRIENSAAASRCWKRRASTSTLPSSMR